jgi:hypothetical protein
MLAQQQVRLLTGLTRLLARLLRSLLWPELSPAERRRVLLFMARLEHDLDLLRHVTRSQRLSVEEDRRKTVA